MGLAHKEFNDGLLVGEEIKRRAGFRIIILGVCYVFGALLIIMGISFFYQGLEPEITK